MSDHMPVQPKEDAKLSERPEDDEVLAALVTALTLAWNSGSPVAGQSIEQRREIAVVVLRRIRSFRRRGAPIHDRGFCVRDLAKGLVACCEAEPKLVGPLMRDYEFVASRLLDAYQTIGG